MIKMTFTLDEDAVRQLERAAARLSMPKSRVVREALRVYGEELGRLSEVEREKMLGIFDDVVPCIPDRPREEVERELAEVRRERLSHQPDSAHVGFHERRSDEYRPTGG